jgi:hypothetical protein
MRASIDYRVRPRTVTLTMRLDEFRDHVRWLEVIDPGDGCTKDWRAELDRIDPPSTDETEAAAGRW